MKDPYTFWGMLWRLVLAGGLVLSASAAGGYVAARHLIETPEVQAPDLLKLALPQALERASGEGFSVILEKKEPTSLLPAGQVLSQRPAPLAWVKEGATLRLTVAEKLK